MNKSVNKQEMLIARKGQLIERYQIVIYRLDEIIDQAHYPENYSPAEYEELMTRCRNLLVECDTLENKLRSEFKIDINKLDFMNHG